jgi:hypothetical protein
MGASPNIYKGDLEMQNIDVIHEFLHGGKDCHTTNVKHVRGLLVNYSTVIAKVTGSELTISTHNYSRTTSKIQNQIRNGARRLGYKIVEVDEL